MQCRICGNKEENRLFDAREMMMGSREVFRYLECGNCKCLQIAEVPDSISAYYSDDYYSFKKQEPSNFLQKLLKKWRNKYAVFSHPSFAKYIYRRFPKLDLRSLSKIDIHREMRILDVGCGSGDLLCDLDQLGFKKLTGIDPYNSPKVIEISSSTKVYKKKLDEVKGSWDLIMMHHVFEHMQNPLQVLDQIYQRLVWGGCCLIRIPLVQSFAWQQFGVNWVQLDPPRHIFVHSPQSMNYLAEQTDFKVETPIYDSTAFQFWGSMQYKNDIPLQGEHSYAVSPNQSIFSKQDIQAFSKRADKLNKSGRGDQAIFILHKQR